MSDREEILPRGWALATVGDTGKYINGFAFKPSHWGPTGLPIIRIQNLTNSKTTLNRTTLNLPEGMLVKPGEILVSWSATLDVFIWKGELAALNQHIFRLEPDEKLVRPKFLFYLLKQAIWEMTKTEHLHGSTMRHINRGPFLAHVVRIPPMREQDRITDEIDKQFTRLEAGIAALKRAQANLKRYRAAVLKAAVEGRLVPTEAELARREGRTYETAEELLQRILAERRARWEADQLTKFRASGKLPKDDKWKEKYQEPERPDTTNLPRPPEGWSRVSLEQISWHAGYGTSHKCDYGLSGQPVLRIPNILRGKVDLGDLKFATDGWDPTQPDSLIPGDMLIVRTNGSRDLIGRAAVVEQSFQQPHYFASYLIRYRLVPIGALSKWVGATWDESANRQRVEALAATTAGQYNVSVAKLNGLTLPLPPHAEIQRIVAEVQRRISLLDELELQVEDNRKRADRLRRAILQWAFAGKLVPQDADDEPAILILERIRDHRTKSQSANGRPSERVQS